MKSLKVAVIMGGTSFERDFSLKSGKLVCDKLQAVGHEVLPLDADANLVDTLRTERPDVAFVCLHGGGGEDGSVPALLEFLRVPYVGSRAAACRAAWNKPDLPFVMRRAYDASEHVALWPAEVALPMNAFRDYGAAKALDLIADRIGKGGFPLAVKPAHGGSAMGVSRVDSADELGEAIMGAFAFDSTVLIQEWVDGVELSCTVLDTGDGPRVLPPVEIVPEGGMFDLEARLDTSKTAYYCPAQESSITGEGLRLVERAALEVYNAFDARDLARVDILWDGEHPRVADIKTFPGLTEISLVPMAIQAAGLRLGETLSALVENAYNRVN